MGFESGFPCERIYTHRVFGVSVGNRLFSSHSNSLKRLIAPHITVIELVGWLDACASVLVSFSRAFLPVFVCVCLVFGVHTEKYTLASHKSNAKVMGHNVCL